MLDFNRFEWLSFDCYGTLVDWETGISNAVAGVFARHGVRKSRSEILSLFSNAEPKVQISGEFLDYRIGCTARRDADNTGGSWEAETHSDRLLDWETGISNAEILSLFSNAEPKGDYRRVLRDVMQIMSWEASIRLPAAEADADALAESLPCWPVFPDAPDALRQLKSRYKLAIISNVDDDLFARSAQALGVNFDAVITSQQARSYKPDLRNFEIARKRMGVEKERWLHIGESLYHDIGPANQMGIDSVWVNRPDRGGGTRATEALPSLEVPDLAALTLLACGER